MEAKVSLLGDGGYSRVVLVSCSIQDKGGKKYKQPMLGLVKKVKKEDEEEKEEGVDLRRK
jgi:hypothetical protein